jgi:cyclase
MPLCYAGGVKTVAQIDHIIGLGVEKVALGNAAVKIPELITEAARHVGSQSIVVVLDVKKSGLFRRYEVFTHNGKQATGLQPAEYAKKVEDLGAGEILVNAIDLDGTMKGYDYELIDSIRQAVHLPITVLGGAGGSEDLKQLIERYGIIGAAAGSMFVFKGKYRAVLIQYPSDTEKDIILA